MISWLIPGVSFWAKFYIRARTILITEMNTVKVQLKTNLWKSELFLKCTCSGCRWIFSLSVWLSGRLALCLLFSLSLCLSLSVSVCLSLFLSLSLSLSLSLPFTFPKWVWGRMKMIPFWSIWYCSLWDWGQIPVAPDGCHTSKTKLKSNRSCPLTWYWPFSIICISDEEYSFSSLR